MPELPDVEEFRRRLERHGRGRRLREVEVLDSGVVRNTRPATLRRALARRRLEPPERRSKWLLPTKCCGGPACTPAAAPGSFAAREWDALHRPLGTVLLRASVKEGQVPTRRSWLTGVRDDPDPTCPRCRTGLRRTRTGSRATLWCPACQPSRS